MNYFLVSYYCRLPKGGWGFSRKYYACQGPFTLSAFEGEISAETRLPINDVCVLSRTPVDVEEYNANVEEEVVPVNQLSLPMEEQVEQV